MKIAFIFPGQGMQEPGMPAFLRQASPERGCLERSLGRDLLDAAERRSVLLDRTYVLQPVLVAVCAATAARLLGAGIHPAAVAGHSIGEVAAWATATGLPAEDAINLAAARGRLMEREAARRPGGMLALQESNRDVALEALAFGERHGVLSVAAVNAPDQWVLSGEIPALDAVSSRFQCRRLSVAGAWHSPLMAGAVAELLLEVRALTAPPLRTALVLNRTGRVLEEGDDIGDALAEQLVRPVQWAACLETLQSLEITDIVTVGPGRISRGLIRKNLGTRARVHTTEDDLDIERTIERLKGAFDG